LIFLFGVFRAREVYTSRAERGFYYGRKASQ
jgi:hypothetical protein